jgi:thiamine biosynthesis lipoprotein
MQKLEFRAMGCEMLVALDNEDQSAAKRLEDVPHWFEDWEQTLSRFRSDSELSSLNRHAGSYIQVSPIMIEVLKLAKQACLKSSGLVTPMVLRAMETAGYDKDFQLLEEQSFPSNKNPVNIPDANGIEIDEETQIVRIPNGAQLDFGGVAKGWAAHKAMNMLSELGPVLVDAGGDIAINSVRSGNFPWVIGVNDPFNRGAYIERIYLGEGGVATSGRDHRQWRQGGELRHHIIDPRTGRPAETDLLSVTVVAQDVLEAEMAAKTVLILGSRSGMDWLDCQEGVAGLAVLENGELLGSHGIERYLRN